MNEEKKDTSLKILIATLTRQRPEMLSDLLTSWMGLDLPPGNEVCFLVVENDDRPNSKKLVQSFLASDGSAQVQYVLETKLGIPFARNRVLEVARSDSMDLLCFIDDDEVVTKNWLIELLREYRRSDAVLIGGPARPRRPVFPLKKAPEAIFVALELEDARKERHWANKAKRADYSHITVGTYNWMLDLKATRKLNPRFDEKMKWSGGSDAQFCADIISQGKSISWAPDAIVYETLPAERLTSYYILNTARERYKTYLVRKLRKNSLNAIYIAVLLPLKLAGILIALPVSVFKKQIWIKLLRACGWSWAVFDVLFRKPSRLYEKTTGY
ncbi:glycosyltransferase family 2 protein [Cycloclasticus sp.]|uniref:glycosyltransferase family 2 protein n=1 Tax=Cycloclasticus sp. TaxID=2024830 RepID=UPI000C0F31D1|nr:glycosyltransferase family 2 protein [Cycloclasticus sp.]PHR46881.1 MAG: hypothetical protein COA48_11690 [Cycloclasticus sp.]